MGATVVGDTIYISKDLLSKINARERKIILAHELSHWERKDRIRLIIAKILLFPFPFLFKRYKKHLETIADKFSITKTKDVDAYISLLDKLNRDETYPSRESSLQLAESMKGRL